MNYKIILATWNKEKIKWLTEGFQDLQLEIREINPNEVKEVEETGSTCIENAVLKVNSVKDINNVIIIGEDSGLSIDSLDGFPGVKTVRWFPGSDDDRAKEILKRMTEIPESKRTAFFESSLAIKFPDSYIHKVEGKLLGSISKALLGKPGEGYKRIFIQKNGLSLAESGSSIVQENDHRHQAISKAKAVIKTWFENRG